VVLLNTLDQVEVQGSSGKEAEHLGLVEAVSSGQVVHQEVWWYVWAKWFIRSAGSSGVNGNI
jgi:hypothetical protein